MTAIASDTPNTIKVDLASIESRMRRLVMGVAFAIVIATPILTAGLLKLLENTSKPLALGEETIMITPETAPEAEGVQESPETAPEAEGVQESPETAPEAEGVQESPETAPEAEGVQESPETAPEAEGVQESPETAPQNL